MFTKCFSFFCKNFKENFSKLIEFYFFQIFLVSEKKLKTEKCQEHEFECDNRCLPVAYKCNGVTECLDGADELNCPEKGELFYKKILSLFHKRKQQNFRKIKRKLCLKIFLQNFL